MKTTIWYRPEFSREGGKCYCGAVSIGRTVYYNGSNSCRRYQCHLHLPAEAHAFDMSVVERAS